MNSHRATGPRRRDNGERKRAYAVVRAPWGMSVADRIKLHAKVDPASGCWVWQLALVPVTGYAALTVDGKRLLGHRASYESFVGPIPAGLHIDHLCRNRACVNPNHLEPVTPLVNVRRGEARGVRAEGCPYGHRYNDENTYRIKGRRYCRTCREAYRRAYRAMTPDERRARKDAGLPVVDLAAHFEGMEAVA